MLKPNDDAFKRNQIKYYLHIYKLGQNMYPIVARARVTIRQIKKSAYKKKGAYKGYNKNKTE